MSESISTFFCLAFSLYVLKSLYVNTVTSTPYCQYNLLMHTPDKLTGSHEFVCKEEQEPPNAVPTRLAGSQYQGRGCSVIACKVHTPTYFPHIYDIETRRTTK